MRALLVTFNSLAQQQHAHRLLLHVLVVLLCPLPYPIPRMVGTQLFLRAVPCLVRAQNMHALVALVAFAGGVLSRKRAANAHVRVCTHLRARHRGVPSRVGGHVIRGVRG